MRIQNKLIAIFFLTSTVLVAGLVLVLQWSIDKGMVDYVNAKELEAMAPVAVSLANEYQISNSWRSMENNHRRFRQLIEQELRGTLFGPPDRVRPPGPNGRPPPRLNGKPPPKRKGGPDREPPRGRRGEPPLVSYALLDINKELLVGFYSPKQSFSFIDIIVNGKTVGYFAASRRDQLTSGYELNFVEQQQRYIAFIALGLFFIAMAVALPLAKHLVVPIKELAQAMSELTSGDYKKRIQLKRRDEFAQLSRDFNELAATLEQNEDARKRWLADISHELRTPIAVLKGEMEAVLDGVRPLDMKLIKSSSEEIKQLEQLLEDLHELTRSDLGTMHYEKQHMNLVSLLAEEMEQYQTLLNESGLRSNLACSASELYVYADAKRLKQLFANLFTNAVKYAANGSEVRITLTRLEPYAEKKLELLFEDNGDGVEEKNLSMLFEHLFRVESSRSRSTGGSGLGLSICKKIVEAHHGNISAFQSSMGGLGIRITLPVEE